MEVPYNIQKRTFRFSVQVVRFCRRLTLADPVSRRLSWELLDSATAVGANMEEADGGQSPRDFISKVAIARKEAQEALYWLRLLSVTDAALRDELVPLVDEATQIARILSTIKKNAEANLKTRPRRQIPATADL